MDFDDNYNAASGSYEDEPHNFEEEMSEDTFAYEKWRDIRTHKTMIRNVCGKDCDSYALDDLYFPVPHTHEEKSRIVLEDKHMILSWAASTLSASPSALKMLSEAEEQGWAIALESLDGHDFHLDVPEKTIVLDNHNLVIPALGRSEYFLNATLVAFIRALRDVWQEKRHGAFDAEYAPENVMTLERVRAADLDVLTVLIAWELRSEGLGSLWRHMIGSDEGDIAMRFSGCMERDPSSQFNGKALQEAFRQWFRDESRVNACDHVILDYLDAVAEIALEEGRKDTAFGNDKLTAGRVEILSCLPDKTAYLQGMGHEILSNPEYAGLDDEFNQAHLMQILYDLRVVRVQDVPFRDQQLADKIFPNGLFTDEDEGMSSV